MTFGLLPVVFFIRDKLNKHKVTYILYFIYTFILFLYIALNYAILLPYFNQDHRKNTKITYNRFMNETYALNKLYKRRKIKPTEKR